MALNPPIGILTYADLPTNVSGTGPGKTIVTPSVNRTSVQINTPVIPTGDTKYREYFYISAIDSTTGAITWSAYEPILLMDDTKPDCAWATYGSPNLTSNMVQFPALNIKCFAYDVLNKVFYTWDPTYNSRAGQWI